MQPILVSYAFLLLKAAAVTLEISVAALIGGTIVGALVGHAGQSRYRALRWAATLFTELFRSVPILLLMFFSYYGLPLLIGHDLSAFAAATLALTLEAGALMAEVVRASLLSVPRGQHDAAAALGMSPRQVLVLIIGPQALRVALPPSIGVLIAVLKDSSVASVIGYLELTKTGLLIRETSSLGPQALAGVAVLYFVINFGLSSAGAAVERRLT